MLVYVSGNSSQLYTSDFPLSSALEVGDVLPTQYSPSMLCECH